MQGLVLKKNINLFYYDELFCELFIGKYLCYFQWLLVSLNYKTRVI